MIRLLIVDDHAFVRQGLERLVATWEGIDVAGTAGDGPGAVAAYTAAHPDVALMDIGLGGGEDGVDATRRIIEADPAARVVMLTSYPDQDHVERALAAGAVGYVLKYAAAEDIERAVRAAARGESPLDPKVAGLLVRRLSGDGPWKGLSARELEVLALVARGLPNKLIARKLEISERTVKGHLTNIYRQTGVTDRVQAALLMRADARPEPGAPAPRD